MKGMKEDKKRYSGRTILRLGRYMLQYKWMLTLAFLCTLGSNLFSLIGPKLTGLCIGAVEPGRGAVDFGAVFYYGAWMAGFYVISAGMSYGLQVLMLTISRRVVFRMRQEVFEKLMALPVGDFDTHQTGDVISRISYDIDTVNASLSNDLVQLLTTVITVAGALVMMVTISPRLVLVFAFTVPLSLFITKYITGRTRPLFRKRSASLGELNGFVEEMISGQKTLKVYGREEYTQSRFEKQGGGGGLLPGGILWKRSGTLCEFYQQSFSFSDQCVWGTLVSGRRYECGGYFLLCALFQKVFRTHQ